MDNTSDRRFSWFLIGAIGVLLVMVAVYFSFIYSSSKISIRFNTSYFNAQLIETKDHSQADISLTEPLRARGAMLFAFDKDAKWAASVGDAHHPVDVVWLDSSKRVVSIAKNINSNESFSNILKPKQNARYILVVKGGTVQDDAIKLDSAAEFDLAHKEMFR